MILKVKNKIFLVFERKKNVTEKERKGRVRRRCCTDLVLVKSIQKFI